MSEYEALAKNVVKRTLKIKPKENVIVETWNHGLPIASEFVYQLRAAGARPMLLFEDEEAYWRAVSTLPRTKLGQVGGHEWKALESADAYVFVMGPGDISKLREVGMEKYSAATAYNREWYRRAEKAGIRGARIGMGYVSAQRAAAYGFDYETWRSMMLEASAVEPRAMERAGRKVQRLLSGTGRVEIRAPNGTNLAFDLKGRKAGLETGVWTEDVGEPLVNIPAGEAYVAPDERSPEGTIRFDRPIPYVARWMRGLTFAFDGGRLSKWTAEEGEDIVRGPWGKAKGDKDRIALVSFGLNPKVRTGFLNEYVAAGNVYVAIGANDDVGGKNKTEFYLGATLTGATVTIDGKTVLRNGTLAV